MWFGAADSESVQKQSESLVGEIVGERAWLIAATVRGHTYPLFDQKNLVLVPVLSWFSARTRLLQD